MFGFGSWSAIDVLVGLLRSGGVTNLHQVAIGFVIAACEDKSVIWVLTRTVAPRPCRCLSPSMHVSRLYSRRLDNAAVGAQHDFTPLAMACTSTPCKTTSWLDLPNELIGMILELAAAPPCQNGGELTPNDGPAIYWEPPGSKCVRPSFSAFSNLKSRYRRNHRTILALTLLDRHTRRMMLRVIRRHVLPEFSSGSRPGANLRKKMGHPELREL